MSRRARGPGHHQYGWGMEEMRLVRSADEMRLVADSLAIAQDAVRTVFDRRLVVLFGAPRARPEKRQPAERAGHPHGLPGNKGLMLRLVAAMVKDPGLEFVWQMSNLTGRSKMSCAQAMRAAVRHGVVERAGEKRHSDGESYVSYRIKDSALVDQPFFLRGVALPQRGGAPA